MELHKNLLLFERNDYSNATKVRVIQASIVQELMDISSGNIILM